MRPLPRATSAALNRIIQEGVTFHNTGQFQKALECYERVLRQDRRNHDGLRLSGCALIALSRPQEAVERLEAARAAKPDSPETLGHLADARSALGQFEEAVANARAAIALRPDFPEAMCSLGHALGKTGRFDEAEAALRQALALRPKDPEILNRLGILFRDQDRFNEAAEIYLEAIAAKPSFSKGWNNLGTALKAQNKVEEAAVAFRQAIAIDPRDALARLSLAMVGLLKGELRNSWLNYEYRWIMERNDPQRGFAQPLWRGSEPLAGKTILLHAEQGLGDTIQFVRYASVLAGQGARVVLQVQPALKTLASRVAGVVQTFANGEPPPPFDFHCPLLSLPLALQTDLNSIPGHYPYLTPAQQRVAHWGPRLRVARGPRVGVVWKGNPKHLNDSNRSVPIGIFGRIFGVGGCGFINLNLGLSATEREILAEAGVALEPSDAISDFEDTAAIISLLDLVITVDTSVAHLAGALGKPVWLLLPFAPDWRWMLERGDSPWYPTMSLFRQPAIRQWEPVISAVCGELARLTESAMPSAQA